MVEVSTPTRQMVDKAAKAAGYTIGPVYHGTQSVKRFYKFAGTWNYRFAAEKGTTYFTNNKDVAAGYGVRVVDAYLRMINPLEVDAKGQHWTIISPSALVKAKRDGNDGVIIRNVRDVPAGVPDQVADVYVTFQSSQIKSADPVTYDDNGNVIPLSQRFDSRSEDIRNPRQLMGININDSTQDFTNQILRGEKTIETRSTRSLDPYIGKRVGIVRTGVGKATLVGYATVGEPIFYDSVAKFRRDQSKHRVAPGSAFDMKDRLRYGYPLMQVEAVEPKEIESRGIVARRLNPYTKRSAPGQFSRHPRRIAMKTKEFRNPATPEDLPPAQGAKAKSPQIDTPEFKRWFNGSVVVTQSGKPRIMYHGTGFTNLGEFRSFRSRSQIAGHFAFDPKFAEEFAMQYSSQEYDDEVDDEKKRYATIYPVYLSLKKLFDVRKKEDRDEIEFEFILKRDGDVKGPNGWTWYQLEKAAVVKRMIEAGFDGFLDFEKGSKNEPTGIAAFDSPSIKSAIGNRGTFDPTDPDIRNPRRSMIRTKLSRILEPGDRVLDYDRAQGEDLYRLWDMVHTDKPLTKEALTEIEGLLDDDGVLVIQSGEEPSGLQDHFRKATRYQGMLLVQGPMNPEEARINTEKLRRDLE